MSANSCRCCSVNIPSPSWNCASKACCGSRGAGKSAGGTKGVGGSREEAELLTLVRAGDRTGVGA